MNSIPLSEVLDTGKLIGFIEKHGINAELEPLEKVIARNNAGDSTFGRIFEFDTDFDG